MIDITVDDKVIQIEGIGTIVEKKEWLAKAISEILDKAFYSGETISLWEVEPGNNTKKLIKIWP